MKLPFLAAILVCGSITSFRAQAVSFEYDWTDSSNPSYTGEIFLNASSGSQTLSASSPIVSYSITANGTTFTSANSTLAGNFLSSIIWDATIIDTMSLQISLTTNPNNIPTLSVQDSTINGAGGRTVDGGWDAVPSGSVPDSASTLTLFSISLAALGWYYYRVYQQRQRAAVVKLKR
jgi:hypothetical protein